MALVVFVKRGLPSLMNRIPHVRVSKPFHSVSLTPMKAGTRGVITGPVLLMEKRLVLAIVEQDLRASECYSQTPRQATPSFCGLLESRPGDGFSLSRPEQPGPTSHRLWSSGGRL